VNLDVILEIEFEKEDTKSDDVQRHTDDKPIEKSSKQNLESEDFGLASSIRQDPIIKNWDNSDLESELNTPKHAQMEQEDSDNTPSKESTIPLEGSRLDLKSNELDEGTGTEDSGLKKKKTISMLASDKNCQVNLDVVLETGFQSEDTKSDDDLRHTDDIRPTEKTPRQNFESEDSGLAFSIHQDPIIKNWDSSDLDSELNIPKYVQTAQKDSLGSDNTPSKENTLPLEGSQSNEPDQGTGTEDSGLKKKKTIKNGKGKTASKK